MPRFKLFAGTAIGAILLAGGALAADMPVYYEPEPIPAFGGWYLRGDVGVSFQQVDNLHNVAFNDTATFDSVTILDTDFDPSWFLGLGVGYQINDIFRVDLTGEYRGKSEFKGLDIAVPAGGGGAYFNEYFSKKSEWLFLANGYWDIGTWERFTPFVGAGVGASYVKIHDLQDFNTLSPDGPSATCPVGGNGCAVGDGQWNFAWALYAGLAYSMSPNLVLEVGYRYLNLGDGQTKNMLGNDGSDPVPNNPMHFEDITSHDIKVGLRYLLD